MKKKRSAGYALGCLVLMAIGGLSYVGQVGAKDIGAGPIFVGSPTGLIWNTPTNQPAGGGSGLFPCTVAPGTQAWYFPTSRGFPTINLPTTNFNGTATLTKTPTATLAYTPTQIASFHYVSQTVNRQTGGYTYSLSNATMEGNVLHIHVHLNSNGNGSGGVALSYEFHTAGPITLYEMQDIQTQYGPTTWGGVYTRISATGTYTTLTYGAPTGYYFRHSNSSGGNSTSGERVWTFKVSVEDVKSGEAAYEYVDAYFSVGPLIGTPTPTSAFASATPTVTLTPTGTAWGCSSVPSYSGSDPIAVLSGLEFSYGGCTSILPGFTIPLFGAWGLGDLVVPSVSICVMWVTINAVFMGISIDMVLTPLIILGMAFAIINEFRS